MEFYHGPCLNMCSATGNASASNTEALVWSVCNTSCVRIQVYTSCENTKQVMTIRKKIPTKKKITINKKPAYRESLPCNQN